MSESRQRSRSWFGGDVLAGIFECLPDELVVVAIAVAAVVVVALIVWLVMRLIARASKTAIQLPRVIVRRRPRSREQRVQAT